MRSAIPWTVHGGLLLLALLTFANTLGNEFVYDDNPVLVDNAAAHGVGRIATIFSTASWWPPEEAAHHYRPLTTFSYAVNYSLHGLEPGGYHLVNALLHGLAACLLFTLLRLAGARTWAATAAGLLFVVHPAHVEAVAWVNGRADLMAGLFMLLSLVCHARGGEGGRAWQAGAVVAFLLAGLSKETGYVTPVVLVAWDLLLGRRGATGPGRRRAEYLGHAVVLLFFALVRESLVGGVTVATVTPMASPLAGPSSFLERLLTGGYVIARYWLVLLWPIKLSVDYSPKEITRVGSLADPRAWLAILTLAGYAAAVALAVRRTRLSGFALAMAAIVLAPAANILFPIGTIMAERLLYLPAVALLVPLALALDRLAALRPRQAVGLLVVLLLGYGLRSATRNADWRNDLALFEAAYRASPKSAMANKNLAAALHSAGRNAEALPLAQRATAILPAFPDAHYVTGNILFMLDRPREAIAAYHRCLALTPNHASAHLNLGAAHHAAGAYPRALEEYAIALRLDPDQPIAWYNRVHTLAAMGDAMAAQQALQAAVERYPGFTARAGAEAKVQEAWGLRTAKQMP